MHPGHVVTSSDKTDYDDLSLLGSFKQATNSVDKNSKISSDLGLSMEVTVSSKQEVVMARKDLCIIKQLASDAIR